jgi:prepilin-type N-terminal cleavage/methylation domain-containing protein
MSSLRRRVRNTQRAPSHRSTQGTVFNLIRPSAERVASASDEAFTLIELLVVIVVLGILAAVVVLSLANVNHSARQVSCVTDATTIETAVRNYNVQSTSSNISVEVVGALPGQIVLGDPTTYANATQAQLLISANYIHSWPSGTTGQGYAISLSTVIAGHAAIYVPPGSVANGVDFDSENTTSGCNDPSL